MSVQNETDGKGEQTIKSLIALDRNNAIATVTGVFLQVIVVVGWGDGRTFILRRKRRGRLQGRARFARGHLALIRHGWEQTVRGGGVRAQGEDVVSPTTAIWSVSVRNDAHTDCTSGSRSTNSSPLSTKPLRAPVGSNDGNCGQKGIVPKGKKRNYMNEANIMKEGRRARKKNYTNIMYR